MPRSEIPVSGEEVGAEFLTWLWHAGESGEESDGPSGPVRFQLGQLVKLKAPDGSGAEVTLKGEFVSTAPELFSALHRGALIHSSKVQVDLNGTVLIANLKAPSLTLSGVKLPKDEAKDTGLVVEQGEKAGAEAEADRSRVEDEARLLTRMGLLDQAQDALDAAFKDFLELRGGKAYEGWRKTFDAWVKANVKEAR